MLIKYDPLSSRLFDFKLTSDNQAILITAKALLEDLLLITGKKDHVKLDFMVTMLINLHISWLTTDMISISRKPAVYAAIPTRYRLETESYGISKSITDALYNNEFIDFYRGQKYDNQPGVLSKIHPTSQLTDLIKKCELNLVYRKQPKELIELRESNGHLKDYQDTTVTKRWRFDLVGYNKLIAENKISIFKVPEKTVKDNKVYFNTYTLLNTEAYRPGDLKDVVLKRMWLRRVFNFDFKHGGRLYGGIETMPSVLRANIKINGQKTIELDFKSYQVRMLYHKLRIDYRDDAYSALCQDDPQMREVYKIIALITLNSANERAGLQAIGKELRKQNLTSKIGGTKDSVLKPLLENFKNVHQRLSRYFYSGVGLELQAVDSEITNNILKDFVARGVLVLSVHDSFIAAGDLKYELLKTMKAEYSKVFKYEPEIA